MNKPHQFTAFKIALSRLEAAQALGISPGTFDKWVLEKIMPDGRKIGGRRLWDFGELCSAWQDILDNTDEEAPIEENPFDQTTG